MIYLEHLLTATGGILRYPSKQQRFDAFSHDTRQLTPGELFVAVRGEHSNGHDYLLEAVQRGAAGLLVEAHYLASLSEDDQSTLEQSEVATIAVEDTRIALQAYARAILERWHPTVIAVTGSTGKTSTKEAIATVLAHNFATFRSWQNYNDLLGLPLSLGRLEQRHEYAVLELGCDHPGEIADLCRMIHPHIGVLTNIGLTQMQYFGSVARLAEELGTLLTHLPEDGIAIVHREDEIHARENIIAPITTFSASMAQDVKVAWDGVSFSVGARFIAPCNPLEGDSLHANGTRGAINRAPTESRLLGAHHINTMLAAYFVAQYCGMQPEEIQHALAQVGPLPGRLNPLPGMHGATLLDDTHNAAPASVIAGLETLKALPAGQRIAILGDMLRMGDFEEAAHRLAGQKAVQCVDYLITHGERAAFLAESAQKAGLASKRIVITSTHEDAAQAALRLIKLSRRRVAYPERDSKDVLLIKGSEETRMERVTALLMAEPTQASAQLVRQTPGWKQIVVMRPERPTWVEIDLSAIANNTRQISSIVGPRVRILASLKADAYGHGALKVARTVLHNGASMLGVATVSEAIPLREAGIHAPILVFGYVPHWQMRETVRLDLTLTVYAMESVQALSRAAQALGKTVKLHVKVDTGMGRLGVRFEQTEEIMTLMREIKRLPGLELEGLFTHFAMADAQDQAHAHLQLARFQNVLQVLDVEKLRPPLVHTANSAATLSLPAAHFDMVRPGIALYGLDPSAEVRLPEGFRPALSFKTQVAQVKMLPAGECISYGCTYTTERPTHIAVLPVGYADGFRRAPNNWGTVLIHGQEAPILGRVCMDQCMVDVSHIAHTRVGDEVVLIGRQGSASLSAEEVARRLGTINYEVVSEILARVPRVD